MPEAAPAAAPAAPKVDPFLAKLSKSFVNVLEPTADTPPPPAAKLEEPNPAGDTPPVDEPPAKPEPAPFEGATLGERVAHRAANPPPEKKDEPEPPKEPETPPAPAAAVTPPEPPKPAKKAQVKRSTADELAAKLKQQQTAPPAPAPATPPAPVLEEKPAPESKDDDLTPEQREEIEFARYVEANHPEHKGKEAETRAYLKKLDDYLAKNPITEPGTEEHAEYEKFIKANKPVYKEGERRRLEREQIAAEAVAKSESKFKEELKKSEESTRRKLFELEAKPKVEKEMQEFTSGFGTDIPEEHRAIDPALVKEFSEKGFEALSKTAPIEAQAIAGSINAAESFLQVANGLEALNLENQTHYWIADFLDTQSNHFASNTKPEERRRNGRDFMPWLDYYALRQSKPEEAKKFYTFSPREVLDMIELNAHATVKHRIAELEAAGFSRKRNSSSDTPPPATPATPAPAKVHETPPKSVPGMMPGATPASPKTSPYASFFEKIVPGSSKRI